MQVTLKRTYAFYSSGPCLVGKCSGSTVAAWGQLADGEAEAGLVADILAGLCWLEARWYVDAGHLVKTVESVYLLVVND